MNSWRGYTRNPDGTLTRIVTDHGPSHASIPGHRGSLVVGGPGPNDRDVHRAQTAKAITAAAQRRYYAKARSVEACGLTGRCRHVECVDTRRIEAERLYRSGLSLSEIGRRLGGRDHSTISGLIRRVA